MAIGPLYRVVNESFSNIIPKSIDVRCKITNTVENELKVLFKIIDSLATQEIKTARCVKGKLVMVDGIVIDKWSSKGLEGSEEVVNSVLPIVIDGRYSIWYQSFHPWGGVPDIMVDCGMPQFKNNEIRFNGVRAWYIYKQGEAIKLAPGEWFPKLVVEVKTGKCKRVRDYVAKRKILVGCKGEGWISLPWDKIEEVGEIVKRVMRECRGAY